MKFRKKPVVIEAVQWMTDNFDEISNFAGHHVLANDDGSTLGIKTLEGELNVSPFDWIIKGVKGEFYPCKPDIFDATYEPVEKSLSGAEGK